MTKKIKKPENRYHLPPPRLVLDLCAQLGEAIRFTRMRRGILQERFAESLNCHVNTLRKLEAGEPAVAMQYYLTALCVIDLNLANQLISRVTEFGRSEAAALERVRFTSSPRNRKSKLHETRPEHFPELR